MTFTRRWYLATALVVVAAVGAAWILHTETSWPTAEPGHGSEDAFATGLHPRELVSGRDPNRWTRQQAEFAFRNLPPPPYSLEVRIRGHHGPVVVEADSARVGEIAEGRFVGRFTLEAVPHSGRVTVVLRPTVFRSEDPQRGTLVDRVRLGYESPGRLPMAIVFTMLLPALGVLGAARLGGFGGLGSALWAAGALAVHGASVWTDGLIRSPYFPLAGLEIAAGAAVAALVARSVRSRGPGVVQGAFVALALTIVVQIVAATHPVMVVSDAVFHANKLERLSGGEWFPTSQTQHAQPFRFPYGVSFYAALLPIDSLGFAERVTLVRWGAALAALLGSAVLVVAWGRGLGLAGAAAVALLQVLPLIIDPHSFGNLSNVFGQAVTVAFLAWWMAERPRWIVGGVLVALAGTAHLSSLIVLATVTAGMAIADRGRLRPARLAAIVLGGALIAVYYAPFVGMILGQIPRLLEGGGQGTAEVSGILGALRRQGLALLSDIGWPALLLTAVGFAQGGWRRVPPAVRGYAWGAAVLAVPAIVSPLEVRYLLALAPVLGLMAAFGLLGLWAWGSVGRLAAVLLAGAQAWLSCTRIVEAVLYRYRV